MDEFRHSQLNYIVFLTPLLVRNVNALYKYNMKGLYFTLRENCTIFFKECVDTVRFLCEKVFGPLGQLNILWMRYLFRIGNFDNLICYLCTMIKIDIYGGLTKLLTLSLPQWSISNFPCSLTRNITPRSMKKLAFHSLLRWKMIMLPILTTSLIHFYPEGWENVLFELGGVRFCAMRRRASGNSFRKTLTLSLPSSKTTFSQPS